jgi:gluconolactonase
MNKIVRLLFIVAVAGAAAGCEGIHPDVSGEVKQVATGFKFTEGPAVAPNGDIYFTDIPNSRIHVWSAKGRLSMYRENTGGANGLLFDRYSNLLVCEGGNRRLTSISPKRIVTILADNFNGKKFNSPNDLWIDSKGGVYFTDPRYGKRDNLEQDGEHVYYLPPEGGVSKRVIEDMVRPNGIIGTPDGKKLYVADHGDKKIFSYSVDNNGTLSGKKLFAEEGSDGMTLDSIGNLYLTTDAVLVYNPGGKLLRRIEVPERPSNVCFGKDEEMLFITARTSLYAIRLRISQGKEKY